MRAAQPKHEPHRGLVLGRGWCLPARVDVFDPDALGLGEDFDTENCTLSEWFEYMAKVAEHWRSEALTLVSQITELLEDPD